jgi:iron complex outermembrane receptor protein
LWDVNPRNRLVTGISFTHSPRGDYRQWYDDVLDSTVDRVFSTAAFYLQDELFVAPWASVVFGGRFDMESDSKTRVTPRASVLLRPGDGTTLKFLYGEAFRSPNIYERTYGADVRTTELGPERIRATEFVAEHRFTHSATARLSLFNDQITHLIDPYVDPATDYYTFENAGTARTRGFEGEVTLGLGRWLVNGGGTVLTATDRSTGERLTNAPSRMIRVGANGTVLPRVSMAVQVRAESGRRTTRGNETNAFGLLDAGLTYRAGSHLRASAMIANAFNQVYSHPGGFEHEQDAIEQDGRRLRLRLEVN